MRKKSYILFSLIIILLLGIDISWGSNRTNIPSMIKIGLRHGEQSAALVSLHSSSGFEFGYYEENRFYNLFNLMDIEDIIVRKDGYYSRLNSTYIETNLGEGEFGPYHVQVGDTFPSKGEMEGFLNTLEDKSLYYPVYEKGWKVWSGLFVSQEQAKEFIDRTEKINDKKLKVVKPNNGRVVVLDKRGKVLFIYNSLQKEYNFRPFLDKDGNDTISVDGNKFRGEIIIRRFSDSDMTIINYLGMDEYLYGVLPKEMSGSWPLEALKAQAVAARNYTIANMNKHKKHGFNLCNTVDCQVYGGYEVEKSRSNRAVDETSGRIVTYNGKIVSTFFHSNSGGRTEDSENIWSISLPYIKGVEDQFSIGAPNSTWTKVYTPLELRNILNSKGMNIGEIKNIYTQDYSKNGRVLSLKIKDESEEITLVKEKTRALLGYNNIKSMCFDLSTDVDCYIKGSDMSNITKKPLSKINILSGDKAITTSSQGTYHVFNGDNYKTFSGPPTKYIFSGKGWGHGLGMSQWGAKKMAELGYTYEDILKHYYTGIEIE